MKATHSKSQKQTRLPIRYLYFILSFKPLIDKEVIKVFQNYKKYLEIFSFCSFVKCYYLWNPKKTLNKSYIDHEERFSSIRPHF